CARCATALAAGARFCQQCGNPVAAQALFAAVPGAPPATSRVPWIIGGVASAALLVLVVAQRMGTSVTPATQPLSSPPEAASALRAPDISQMTPRDRASRLFDRIMRLDEEGKRDSVQLFASMAIPTFQSLAPLDAHLRYDFGRVAVAADQLELAQAQVDTILQAKPQHLLGLILAAKIAERRGDTTSAARFYTRLVAAESSERALGLEEYQLHDADIRAAVTAVRDRR
ncbi:MAG: hypothetical protein ACT4P6_05925, partial [Gemmatimonadaceae bacterium]